MSYRVVLFSSGLPKTFGKLPPDTKPVLLVNYKFEGLRIIWRNWIMGPIVQIDVLLRFLYRNVMCKIKN